MPKSLPAQVLSQINADNQRPILIVELYLDSGTLRFSTTKGNIIFPTGGSTTFTAKAMEVSNIIQGAEGQIGRVSVKFDNVSGDMTGYLDAEDFYGKKLVIKRIYVDALGDVSYYNELFRGFCEEVSEVDRYSMTVPATSGKALQHRVLQRIFQKRCNRIFGDAVCNQDGYAVVSSTTPGLWAKGTADSGTTITLVDAGLTQANDYWNYGRIDIGYSGTTYYRTVQDFVAASDKVWLDVPLSFSVDNTCKFHIYKGCSKTWDSCSGTTNPWGPKADNRANFQGFLHVGGNIGGGE